MPRNLLFVGDFGVTTGFARVNEAILSRIDREKWTPHILGINTNGDPHPIRRTFEFIYPASEAGHSYGINRLGPLVEALKPPIVVIHQDAWIVPEYLITAVQQGFTDMPPVLAYCPPDAQNQPAGVKLEGKIARLLCPTAFGIRELRKGGYTGPAFELPYGVERDVFTPGSRREAREWLGFPEKFLKGFVVGRADRNAQRKRYDLTLEGWRMWWHQAGRPEDAALYLHCVPKDLPSGWDLPQLAGYYGIADQVLWTGYMENAGRLPPVEKLVQVYRSWDVHLSTVHGEGWGLVAHESAACGVMQVVPHSAAYAEWLAQAAYFIPAKGRHVHAGGINTIGTVVRPEDVATALQTVYTNAALRDSLGAKARHRAAEDRFVWDTIAAEFGRHLDEVALAA